MKFRVYIIVDSVKVAVTKALTRAQAEAVMERLQAKREFRNAKFLVA